MFGSKAGAYPSEAPFRFFTLVWAPGLTNKYLTRLERFAKDKHSTLLRIFKNYDRKKFYNISPLWCLILQPVSSFFTTRAQFLKTFFFVTYKDAIKARVFVLGMPFQPSLMFSDKARIQPMSLSNCCCFTRVGSGLTQKIRLGWKGLLMTNTLASFVLL